MTSTEIITPEPATVRRCYLHPETGKKLPGVTDILGDNLGWSKEALMGWANREGRFGRSHEATRDRAAAVGTQAHEYVERHLRGKPTDELGIFSTPIEEKAFRAYRRWAAWWPTSGYEAVHVELPLVHPELGYGGTTDAVFRRETHAVIGDLKSGKKPHDEVLIQMGAYATLLTRHGIRVSSGVVMHFPVEGEPHVIPVSIEQLRIGAAAFIALLSIHNWRPSLRLKKGV